MKPYIEELTTEKIVPEGKCLSTLNSGKKVFYYGSLPGEKVLVEVYKNKKDFCLANLIEIITPSPDREIPKDENLYISTSPFQVLKYSLELKIKENLIFESFRQNGINLKLQGDYVYTDGNEYFYRNKMEYSFYFDKDEDKLFLCFFKRGSHTKIKMLTESLAKTEITDHALHVLSLLNKLNIEGRQLKSLIVRANKEGNVLSQLYTKDESLMEFKNLESEIIYSNPKSPASVITKRNTDGATLSDRLLDREFSYRGESFFQINLPVFEEALKDIKKFVQANPCGNVLDFYSGVGSIGLNIENKNVTLVEINEFAYKEMTSNLGSKKNITPILSSAEDATGYIDSKSILILDPPRAGISQIVVSRILSELPPLVIYLSCNPITQARDVAFLTKQYEIVFNRGYNFFPKTPHIEHLVVLELKP